MVWLCIKGNASPRWEVPKGTVMLRGARSETWLAVTARSRSSRRALPAPRPKQAHGDTGSILALQRILTQPRKAPVSIRSRTPLF